MRLANIQAMIDEIRDGFHSWKNKVISVSVNGKGYIYEIENKDVGLFFIKVEVNQPQRIEDIAATVFGGFDGYRFQGTKGIILDWQMEMPVGLVSIIGIPKSERMN
ncbi:hypothetical protein [Enterococcus sp. C50]|uniref:hypothetical protein n=1 Tax=Enterococcus sp. C50 TaxID=3231311 RepID=UPI00349FD5E4